MSIVDFPATDCSPQAADAGSPQEVLIPSPLSVFGGLSKRQKLKLYREWMRNRQSALEWEFVIMTGYHPKDFGGGRKPWGRRKSNEQS